MSGYWVNDKACLYWEIVGPDGTVHEVVEKTSDDDNRAAAQAVADRLNARGPVARIAAGIADAHREIDGLHDNDPSLSPETDC